MASKVTTLFEDSAKQNALYPRTKVSAVSDGSGTGLNLLLDGKQDTLVSGTNIKTVDSQSIVGSGNVVSAFDGIDTSNVLGSNTGSNGTTISNVSYNVNAWIVLKEHQCDTLKIDGNAVSIGIRTNSTYNRAVSVIFPLKSGQQWTCSHAVYYAYGSKR